MSDQEKDTAAEKLSQLIAKAQEKAQEAVARSSGAVTGKAPSVRRKAAKPAPAAKKPPVDVAVEFTEEDVCDERAFIIRTRTSNYHTPEMRRLFWANGGDTYIQSGLTYAQAFHMLRDSKQQVLQSKLRERK